MMVKTPSGAVANLHEIAELVSAVTKGGEQLAKLFEQLDRRAAELEETEKRLKYEADQLAAQKAAAESLFAAARHAQEQLEALRTDVEKRRLALEDEERAIALRQRELANLMAESAGRNAPSGGLAVS